MHFWAYLVLKMQMKPFIFQCGFFFFFSYETMVLESICILASALCWYLVALLCRFSTLSVFCWNTLFSSCSIFLLYGSGDPSFSTILGLCKNLYCMWHCFCCTASCTVTLLFSCTTQTHSFEEIMYTFLHLYKRNFLVVSDMLTYIHYILLYNLYRKLCALKTNLSEGIAQILIHFQSLSVFFFIERNVLSHHVWIVQVLLRSAKVIYHRICALCKQVYV